MIRRYAQVIGMVFNVGAGMDEVERRVSQLEVRPRSQWRRFLTTVKSSCGQNRLARRGEWNVRERYV
jgi:hypothetical protein